jgi:hypothetical protein
MCYIYSHIHLHVDRRDVHTYINWLARCRIYVRTRGQSAGRHSCKACNSCLYYARWSRCKGKPQQDDLSAQNDSQSRIKVLSVIIIFTSSVAKITSISSLSDKKGFGSKLRFSSSWKMSTICSVSSIFHPAKLRINPLYTPIWLCLYWLLFK